MYHCGAANLWYNSGMSLIDFKNDLKNHQRATTYTEILAKSTVLELTATQRNAQAVIAIVNIERMSDWRFTEKQWKLGESFHRGETNESQPFYIKRLQPFYTFKTLCGFKTLTCEFNNLLAFECELKHDLIEKILKILDPIPW